MIQSSISSALYNSQLYTIDSLVEYIKLNNIEYIDKFIPILNDFKSNISCDTNQQENICSIVQIKSKKSPSAYNLYIRDKINEYKKMYPQTNGHDLMRLATSAWKRDHGTKTV